MSYFSLITSKCSKGGTFWNNRKHNLLITNTDFFTPCLGGTIWNISAQSLHTPLT